MNTARNQVRLIQERVKSYSSRRTLLWLAICFLFIPVLAGCNSAGSATALPTGTVPASVTASPTPVTPTVPPTPTPQPRAILWAPPQADPDQAAGLEALLTELAAGAGLSLDVVQTLDSANLSPAVKVVLVLPPDPGVAAAAAAAPQIQFLAVDLPGLQPGPNLNSISAQAARPDQQGFLAGYLASLVTPDWRVGVISPGDDPAGKANRQGFINGVVFYCGLCRPAYPPFVQYPVTIELPPGASPADEQAAADALIAQGVTTAYVAPGAGNPGLLEYLAQQGVNLIGTASPPANVGEHWIATIGADLEAALRQAWDQALGLPAASDPQSETSSPALAITDRNEALFSIGRQRLAEQVQAELASGLIDTGVDPQTGELR